MSPTGNMETRLVCRICNRNQSQRWKIQRHANIDLFLLDPITYCGTGTLPSAEVQRITAVGKHSPPRKCPGRRCCHRRRSKVLHLWRSAGSTLGPCCDLRLHAAWGLFSSFWTLRASGLKVTQTKSQDKRKLKNFQVDYSLVYLWDEYMANHFSPR